MAVDKPILQSIYRSKAVGSAGNLPGISPGFLMRGVTIDNPSGSWVVIRETAQYIPPYTLGWASTLLPGQQSMTVEYDGGPIGLVSTDTGDPMVVYVYSEPIPNSPGSPFVGLNPVTTTNQTTVTATAVGVVTTLASPPTAKNRLRVNRVAFTYSAVASSARDVPVEARFRDSLTLAVLSTIYLHPYMTFGESNLGDGVDLTLGASLEVRTITLWAAVSVVAQYSVTTI